MACKKVLDKKNSLLPLEKNNVLQMFDKNKNKSFHMYEQSFS